MTVATQTFVSNNVKKTNKDQFMDNKESKSYIDYFTKLFNNKNKNHVVILTHDNPDPDALASAMAVREICEQIFNINTTIFYGGDLGHTQNRVMNNVLDIRAERLDQTKSEIESEDDSDSSSVAAKIKEILQTSYIILVDCYNFKISPCKEIENWVNEDKKPDLIIDHHGCPLEQDIPIIYNKYGSCSTILYEILKETEINISKSLATALYCGISTDTHDLRSESTTENDVTARNELKEEMDAEAYLKIFHYPKPQGLIELRKKAYANIFIESDYMITNVGVIAPTQKVSIAEICDEMLQFESIRTAVVMAIVDPGEKHEKALIASCRSSQLSVNMQELMSSIFGKKNAGGRLAAGGARVALDPPFRSVIDHIRRTDGNNGNLTLFTKFYFSCFSEKIKHAISNL